MGRRETHGKYNKRAKDGRAEKKPQGAYVRTISLDGFADSARSAEQMTLKVRGMVRGAVQMVAVDGTT